MFNRFGNVSTLRSLTGLIKDKRVIPFVGAGMSIDIYGSWGAALERIMDGHVFGTDAQSVHELIGCGRYEEAAEEISKLSGETCFQDQLVEVFGEFALEDDKEVLTDDALKKMSVRYLPLLFENTLVVTTNFDKVLERTFLMGQRSFTEKVVLSHLSKWQAERSQRNALHYLIKIHGCVSAPDEVVMTKKSYDYLYNEELPHIARLRRLLQGNTLLFIGCSLNQDRTVKLLGEENLGGHYAILEMSDDIDEPATKARRLFMSNSLRMHCIWYPKGEHHYVEDILEYIYADMTGQTKAICPEPPAAESVAADDYTSPENYTTPAIATRAPAKTNVTSDMHAAHEASNVQTDSKVETTQPAAKSKPPAIALQPPAQLVVKNELFTFGRWRGKPLEWLVLKVLQDKALLIANDCLLKAPYNNKFEKVTWKSCSTRQELDSKYLERLFDDAERNRVLPCTVKNPDNPRYGTPGGADTDDKLFLLSIDEAIEHFPYDKARIARLDTKSVCWWLRSPGIHSYYAAIVDYDGFVGVSGFNFSCSGAAVRPAFWLNLKS